MKKISKLYYSSIGQFFQGAKLYRLDLENFNSSKDIQAFGDFEFYMPSVVDISLFEKLYENIPGKVENLKNVFNMENYTCFAYLDKKNERLAYTRWICKKEYYSDAMKKQLNFNSDEVLTLDSYTHPDYRYLGLHKNMNIEMLQWLKQYTNIRFVYMVILIFIPHLTRIPLELGYKAVESVFYYKKGSIKSFIKIIKNKLHV